MTTVTEWERRGGTWVRFTDSTAVLTRQTPGSFLADFDYSVNPLGGCSFACAHCYVPALGSVRFRHDLLPDGGAMNSRSAWGRWVEVRTPSERVVQRALERGTLDGARLFMSPLADVYWGGEAQVRQTRALLTRFAERPQFDWLLISTRSPLVIRDIDLLQQLGDKVEVGISIPTDRADVAAVTGRRNASIARRFAAARTLRDAGIATRIHVAPLEPHSEAFVDRLADAAHWVWVDFHIYTSGYVATYVDHGWAPSTPADAESFAAALRLRMGSDHVRVGQAHFADRWRDKTTP